MTPFPETEIMTIKRLEVALRKMDFKLLKDGAYKLHEKYHSGFKFEYLDLLKEIYIDISNNSSIPDDIKDILTPTINDILSSQGVEIDTTTSPFESLNQNRVSSLTSLSYNTPSVEKEEARLSAFDAFGANNSYQQPQMKTFHTLPIQESYKEHNEFQNSYLQQENLQVTNVVQNPIVHDEYPIQENIENIQQKETERIELEQNYIEEPENIEVEKEIKTISILYSQDSSIEKIRNILQYRQLLSKIDKQDISLNEILNLIKEINVQSNTNVSEIKNILEQLKNKENTINFITNSSSNNLSKLFNEVDMEYDLFDNDLQKQVKFIPFFGLTNLFKCRDCQCEYLEDRNEVTSLVLQCPKCKGIMLPEFYANTKNSEINLSLYNKSFISLANSKIWLLIHPSIEDKNTLNLLKSALKVSNQVEDILIVDKDINVRETYRKIFEDINPNIRINIQTNVVGDFFDLIR